MNDNQNRNDNKNKKNLNGLLILLGWAVALTVALLAIVFAGMARNVFPMLSGEPPEYARDLRGFSRTAPLVILIVATLALGLFMPESVSDWIGNAASSVTGVFP